MATTRSVNLLDCTIRDGSYVVDYQFTLRDVAQIGRGLEEAGLRYIEVGHGVGLHGSETLGMGVAAHTDEEYCRIAASTFREAIWGMFFIPGIGRAEDIELAAQHGMGFCRIGYDVDRVEETEEYVGLAKRLGLMATVNLMKSYAVPPEGFAESVARAASFGADVVYLVDSAGGMLPEDVRSYLQAARAGSDCALGFHAHNNLSLATANSLVAVEEGCAFVDACAQGLGRSAGNAVAETLVLLLDRLGVETGVDSLRLLEVGERLVRPMVRHNGGISPIGAVHGYAQFHSSFMPLVSRAASTFGVDPRRLVMAITRHDKLRAPEELVERLAVELAAESETVAPLFDASFDPSVLGADERPAERMAADVRAAARKLGKQSVFAIGFSDSDPPRFPAVRETGTAVIGTAEVSDREQLESVLEAVRDRVDQVLIDTSCRFTVAGSLDAYWDERTAPYDDVATLVDSLTRFILYMRRAQDRRVLLLGGTAHVAPLALALGRLGLEVILWDRDAASASATAGHLNALAEHQPPIAAAGDHIKAASRCAIVVVLGGTELSSDIIDAVAVDSLVVDGVGGSIAPGAALAAKHRGVRLYRFDTRIGLAAAVAAAEQVQELAGRAIGVAPRDGYSIVAGGVVGARGDVIVDSVGDPMRIIGVADGRGGVLPDAEASAFEPNTRDAEIWLLNQSAGVQEGQPGDA